MSTHVTLVNRLFRARRELKMIRRIVILVIVVIIIGFPYASFILVSFFFTTPPRYDFRIAYIFVDISMTFVMIMLFQFTEPVRASIMRIIHGRNNTILPTMT